MIKVKHEKNTYEVRNEPKEISIGEFERISKLYSQDDLGYIEKTFGALEILGLPSEVCDQLDDEEFIEITKELNLTDYKAEGYTKEIEIEGFIYSAYDGEEFKLKARDLREIERLIKANQYAFSEVIAVIFKRDDLDSKEHYASGHIKHKAKLISKEVMTDVALPYIGYIMNKILNRIKKA